MATRTWVGTTNTNWGTTTNWLEGAVPTNADDVVIAATPLNDITLNASARVCKSIDFTNFGTRTITFSNTLTVSGNVKLISTMVFSGSSTLILNASATLTSNTKTCGVPLQLSTNATYTLADDWTVSGLVTIGGSSAAIVINGNTLNMGAGLAATSTNSISGTTNLVFTGTGTWTGGGASIRNNLEIKAGAGTVTVSGNVYFGGGSNTLLYTSGTVVTTSSTLFIANSLTSVSTTFNCASITWNNITSTVTNTWTLSANINMSGTLTLGATSTTITLNGNTINVGGSLTCNNTSSGVVGTTTINLNGTGTWSHLGAGSISNNLTINTAGTITVSGNVYYRTGTLTYTAGTVNTTSSTLNIGASTTLNTAGINWNNVTFTGTSLTHTLNSLLTVNGTLSTSGALTGIVFTGTSGFTANTWGDNTAPMAITLEAGRTYTVTNSLTLLGSFGSNIDLKSSTPSTYATLTFTGASQAVGYVTATDINSSLGNTIWDFQGTLTRTLNWNPLTPPITIANISVS